MISISPERFLALLESILDDGYHATENIIVQKSAKGKLIVKEGNRRIAALKYALGQTRISDIPSHIIDIKNNLTKEWIKDNTSVPCAIYLLSETDLVDKLVALTHAKGEKAARDPWSAVARARYARNKKVMPTLGLNLTFPLSKQKDGQETIRLLCWMKLFKNFIQF